MTNLESYYQFYMEKYLGGTHMKLKIGVTDITTATLHAELKVWKDWKTGVGQLNCYSAVENRSELHLYLFGKYGIKNKKNYIDAILINNIKPYEMRITETGFDIIDLQTNIIVHSIINNNQLIDIKHAQILKEEYKFKNITSDEIIKELNNLLNISDEKFTINLDSVAKWLQCSKRQLTLTLRRTYINDIDYTIKNAPNPYNIKGIKGSNNYKQILVTPDCFKKLTVLSRAKNADIIRNYLLKTDILKS